jgi:hypothetical protein
MVLVYPDLCTSRVPAGINRETARPRGDSGGHCDRATATSSAYQLEDWSKILRAGDVFATALLADLRNPQRGFDAVVIGEPHRAFYGNQYGLTFPLFEHYGVPLWVPEVGGPIDPTNEAHELGAVAESGGMSVPRCYT